MADNHLESGSSQLAHAHTVVVPYGSWYKTGSRSAFEVSVVITHQERPEAFPMAHNFLLVKLWINETNILGE